MFDLSSKDVMFSLVGMNGRQLADSTSIYVLLTLGKLNQWLTKRRFLTDGFVRDLFSASITNCFDLFSPTLSNKLSLLIKAVL